MKKYMICIWVSLITVSLLGCSLEENESLEGVTVTDRAGNEVTVPETPERVVVAGASIVEIMTGLGVSENIIAVDTFAADVEGLSEDVVTFDAINPDLEMIVALEPDLVLVNTYATPTTSEVYKTLTDVGIPVAFIPVSDSFDSIYKDITFISEIMGVPEAGEKMISQMKYEIETFSSIAATIPASEKKTVYFENNPAPSMYSCGSETFINEMIETIGAENILASETGWIPVSEEMIVEKNPDVIITNVNFIDDPVSEIINRPGWDTISAVENNQVYYVDTNATSRPTQNIVKGMEEMAKFIYPEYYGE